MRQRETSFERDREPRTRTWLQRLDYCLNDDGGGGGYVIFI